MRKAALYLLLAAVIILLLMFPALAMAESTPGSGAAEGTAAAAEAPVMDHENYTPPEKPADDTTMAAIASTIFALPIAGWFVARSLRKAKKK